MGQQPLTEGLRETLSVFAETGEPWTTPEVADRLDLGRRTAYARLERLVEQDLLETKKVGASARVWWRPPTTPEDDHRDRSPQRREETAFVENLLDAQPDLLYAFDTDGQILRVNDRFREVTGYTDAEIREMHPVEFIADRAARETKAAIEQVLEHGELVTVELPLVTADGTEIPYELTGRPITDEAGEIVGLTGVGRDITERKARERQLERQRDELRAELDDVFTRIDEAFFALDTDWRLTYVNDRAAELVGLPVGELVGARVWDVLPEVAEGPPRETAERAVATGESAEFEFYSEILDVWLEIRLYPSETGLSVYVRDITERKERERELERTLDLLEQTERIANVGGWEVDPETMEVFRTDHLFEILEIPNEEGSSLDRALEIYHEEDRPIVKHAVERALDTGDPYDLEVRFRTPGDEVRWLHVQGVPETTDSEVVSLRGAAQDITERKERERALKQYETLAETASDVILTIDERSRIRSVNPAVEEMFGYAPEDLVGEPLTVLMPDRLADAHEAGIDRYLRTGEHTLDWNHVELPGVTADGTEVPLSISFSEYERDDERYFTGIIRDITARKERERELERTRELLEQTERIANVGGWEIDPETMTVFRTDHLFDILGIDDEEEPPLADGLEIYHEEDRPIVENALEQALNSGEPFDVEAQYRRPDGRVRWLRVRGTPVTENGEVVTLRGSSQDITERKERERDLEEYRRWNETLVENFPNGAVALVDEDLRYVTFGGTPEGDTDLTRADLEGAPVREVLPESLAGVVVPGYEAALEGDPSRFEETIDGRIYQFHFVPVRDDDGDVFAAAAISQDVTERKERERELERQREQLAALNNLHDIVHDITDAVIEQSTREEIETIACKRLAAAPPYEFAWIGEIHPQTESIRPKVEAGVEGYAEAIPLSTAPDEPAGQGPAGEAVRTREMQVTRDALTESDFEPWREYAKTYGYRSAAAIPIVHEDTVYGVLGVYAGRKGAFDGQEREVLAQLGEVIGHAIAAIERKRALTSDEITEIEFTAPDIPDILGIESAMEGTIAFERAVPIGDGEFLEYGTVDEEGMAGLEGFVENHPDLEDVEIVHRGDTAKFKLRASDPPVVSAVASTGGYMEQVQIEDGDLYMRLHLPPTVAVRRIIDAVQEAFPTATLLTQRQITRAENGATRIQRTVTEDLTDRQRAVLEAAMYSGFFKWPRESSGEDVAESLGIAPSTFSQHLRKAQRKVFHSVFESPALA